MPHNRSTAEARAGERAARPRGTRRPQRKAPAEFGTVRQASSGRFRASYRVPDADGTPRTIGAGRTFETREAARAWLAEQQASRYRGTWRDPELGNDRLAEYADDWLASHADLTDRTRAHYRHLLDTWILPRVEHGSTALELGGFPIAKITPALVHRWLTIVRAAAEVSARARATGRPTTRCHPARLWARQTGYPAATQGRMSPTLLQAWQKAGAPVLEAPRTAHTANPDAGRTAAAHAYRLLHTILATAVRHDLLTANPCRERGAGTAEHRERTILAPAEVDALAQLFPEQLRAAVLVAAWSGLRYGELFGLARRHVNLKAGTVKVERALKLVPGQPIGFGKPKTRRSVRTVNLPGFLIDELRRHLAQHVAAYPDALLFTVPSTGNPVSSSYLSARMGRARAENGRPEVTWHDLRHTGATLAYRVGASQREVMNRLGHSTAVAAQIYAHAAEDSDATLAARLDELRAGLAPVVAIGS